MTRKVIYYNEEEKREAHRFSSLKYKRSKNTNEKNLELKKRYEANIEKLEAQLLMLKKKVGTFIIMEK